MKRIVLKTLEPCFWFNGERFDAVPPEPEEPEIDLRPVAVGEPRQRHRQ
jgi:hypothetical protein